MKKKILVVARVPLKGLEELRENFEIIYPEHFSFSTNELMNYIKDADALMSVFTLPVTGEMISHARRLKIIANYGVGFNNIDIKAATSKGIVVCNTPYAVTEPTAEMAMGLLLSLMRRLTETDRKLRYDPNFKWGMMENLGSGLFGKTLGIIGLGRIGSAVARRALAFGMNITYYNRKRLLPETEDQLKANFVPFDDLIQNSDVISLHCPLNTESHHLIDEEQLNKMKDGVFIINTARGAVIHEGALVRFLQNGKIGGAGLDVFEDEPNIPAELFQMENVVLTPHNATGTTETRIELAREASKNILDFFEGRRTISIVNPNVWESISQSFI